MYWAGQSSALGVPVAILDERVEAALIIAVDHSIPFPAKKKKNDDAKNGLHMEIKALTSLLVRWLDGIWSGRRSPLFPILQHHHTVCNLQQPIKFTTVCFTKSL